MKKKKCYCGNDSFIGQDSRRGFYMFCKNKNCKAFIGYYEDEKTLIEYWNKHVIRMKKQKDEQ